MITFEEEHVFAEYLLANFAGKDHFNSLLELMITGFVVTVGTVVPFLAARGTDGSLDIQNMFAHLIKTI